ncbi:toprim domain-containing protein [Endozoicomonas sp. Mp262]|uniref:primase-helicase zinc-binding domain-containing protein n=1 Tax=Endozoicomonas sp. Mp262 TaxID=2919499 RepID=UPI0021D979B2
MKTTLFTEQVKQAAAGHWDDILQSACHLSEKEVNPKANNIPCPHCGGHDRYSFMRIEDGNYICRQCGSGDGFNLIMKIQECDFSSAVKKVAEVLGIEQKPFYTPTKITMHKAQGQMRQQERQRRSEVEAEKQQKLQKLAAIDAAEKMAIGSPATSHHPYLMRKELPPLGSLQKGELLMVGLYTHHHKLVNIEFITGKGKKFGLKHGQRKAVYHRFGSPAWTVYICEGWATGASLYLMENGAVRVYSAMGKGNLEAVACIARDQNPDSRFIIAADNDAHLPTNLGLTSALKAAEIIGATVMLPPAMASCPQGTDFSDFYLANGGQNYGAL